MLSYIMVSTVLVRWSPQARWSRSDSEGCAPAPAPDGMACVASARSHQAPTWSFMLMRLKSSHLIGSSTSIDLGLSRSLNRVRNLGMGGRGLFSEHPYPSYITDELLGFWELSSKDRLVHISTTFWAHAVQTRSPCVLQRPLQSVGNDLPIASTCITIIALT
jgi:hypothetical protein